MLTFAVIVAVALLALALIKWLSTPLNTYGYRGYQIIQTPLGFHIKDKPNSVVSNLIEAYFIIEEMEGDPTNDPS